MSDSETSKTDFRASLRSAALEAGLVVLGVVLAFAANEWRKGQEAEERAHLALDAVAQELEANRASVLDSVIYHREKMVQLNAVAQAGTTVAPKDFDKGFIHPAQLLSNAWDTASATDAILGWDYDQLLAVSELYANQEQYKVQSRGVGQVIYQRLLEHGTQGVVERPGNLAAIVSTFWWQECELLSAYGEVLPQVDRAAPEMPSACTDAVRRAGREQG